jgi:anti-anti-sigma factor
MTEIVRRLVDGSGTLVVTFGSAHEDAVVCAHGEFDLTNSGRIVEILAERLRAGARSVRLDLADVAFVDATAVSAVVHARALYRTRRAALLITGQHGIVARVLALSGVDAEDTTPLPATPLSATR